MIKKSLSLPIFWTIMKWITIVYTWIAIGLLTATAEESYGQVDMDSKLNLREETITLRAALKKISKQTGVDFAYNNRSIPLNKSIRWDAERTDLRTVMNQISETFDIKYQVVGNSLLLQPKEEPTARRPVQHVDIRQYEDPQTQDWVIEGLVLDAETDEPIDGATIELIEAGIRTKSDRNGRFRLVVPASK